MEDYCTHEQFMQGGYGDILPVPVNFCDASVKQIMALTGDWCDLYACGGQFEPRQMGLASPAVHATVRLLAVVFGASFLHR
jgi:hypothetical protein